MEKTDEKKMTTTAGTMKSEDHIVVGTVNKYEAGKVIKVLVGKKTRSFDLDSKSVNSSVDPAVAVAIVNRRSRSWHMRCCHPTGGLS